MEPTTKINPTQPSTTPNMNSAPPMPKNKGGVKKVLAIVIPIVTLFVIGIIILIVILVGKKTSSEALSNFSSSTTSLNSALRSVQSEVQSTSLSSESDKLDSQIADANTALSAFDKAADGLKSDRQELKDAALAFSDQVRSYLNNEVPIAADLAKINAFVADNEPEFDSSTSDDAAAYKVEATRIGDIYADNSTKVKSLDMATSDGKELRDIYIEAYLDLEELIVRIGDAAVAGDRSETLKISSELTALLDEGAAAVKTDELKDKLGTSGEGYKKLEEARERLNGVITKINADR